MSWDDRVAAVRHRLKFYPVPTSTRLEGEAALWTAEDFAEKADEALRRAERIVNPERLD